MNNLKSIKNEIIKNIIDNDFNFKDVDFSKVDAKRIELLNNNINNVLSYYKFDINKYLLILKYKSIIQELYKQNKQLQTFKKLLIILNKDKVNNKNEIEKIELQKMLLQKNIKNDFIDNNNLIELFNSYDAIIDNIKSYLQIRKITKSEMLQNSIIAYNETLQNNFYYSIAKKILYKSLSTLMGKGNIASYKIFYNKSSGVYEELLNEIIVEMLQQKIVLNDYIEFIEISKNLKNDISKNTKYKKLLKSYKNNEISKTDFVKAKKDIKNDILLKKYDFDLFNKILNLYKVVQNYLYNIKHQVNNISIIEFTKNDDDYNKKSDINVLSYNIDNLLVAETETNYKKEEMLNIFKKLNKYQKQVLIMKYVEKLTYPQIAKKLNKTTKQVQKVINKLHISKKVKKI